MTTTITYHVGDVRDVLAELDDSSVDLLVTSPPFLALRSYLPDDHPDKHREIGAEPTPAAFIDTLLGLSADWRRVVADWGSIAVEIGDTYAGSGSPGGDYNEGGMRAGQPRTTYSGSRSRPVSMSAAAPADAAPPTRLRTRRRLEGWPLDKSMCGIPTLYTWSLAYGRNLLTGDPSPAGEWRIRNLLTWTRPNPPVGALGDKFRPATSFVTVATVDERRWFDLDAVRTPLTEPGAVKRHSAAQHNPSLGWKSNSTEIVQNPAGAPPLDWWDANDLDPDEHADWQPLHRLPTQPYKGAHYAAFPVALPRRLIDAMCPREVCTVCGEPRRRVVGPYTLDAYRSSDRPQTRRAVALADKAGLTDAHIAAVRAFGTSDAGKATTLNNGAGRNSDEVKRLAGEAKAVLGGYFREFVMSTNAAPTSTWTDCGHGAYRTGIVLDPFGGSGTTAVAAAQAGRDAILIDLDPRNVDLTRQRITASMHVHREVASHPVPRTDEEGRAGRTPVKGGHIRPIATRFTWHVDGARPAPAKPKPAPPRQLSLAL